MSFLERQKDELSEPLLREKIAKPQKQFKKVLKSRNSLINDDDFYASKTGSQYNGKVIEETRDVEQEVINSAQDLVQEGSLIRMQRDLKNSQKKSIKVQFNKKRHHEKQSQKKVNPGILIQSQKKPVINQTIYQRFEVQGLRIKANWHIQTKSKAKSFNVQIMNLDPKIQHFLYYMNLILNTIFRLSLLAILILMILYQQQYKLMEMIVGMEFICALLYSLAMVKMLYTKKDEESIYLQKHFTDRDITDIQMDRVLRKHFTWRNILNNVSAYFKLNSKFKNDIKISILRQELFKRMEIVLCFIPFTIIFFTTPNIFKFDCDYPIEMIVTGTICLEFVRMTVHYIVIFIQN